MVISKAEEVDNPGAGVKFPTRLTDTLRTVDYKKYFVVLVFRGVFDADDPNVNMTIEILKIVRSGDTVTVQARLRRPESGDLTQSTITSPYHIVKVAKNGVWKEEIRFNLEIGEKEILNRGHFIP